MGREPPAYQRALLRELAYMFGPEVGPAILTHGHSFAERLAADEDLVAEICKRFETARSEGRFPILSALLTGASDEDLEEFFRSGWARMALPPRESSIRRTWDVSPWDGDLEAYREDLYAGMAFGMEDVRAFAREWLEELLRVGYYGMEESLGLPLKQQSKEFFTPPRSRPIYGQAYPARVGEIGQIVWLKLDGPRLPERGYREISVSDEPLRTDAAILAALTALEGRAIDVGTLRKVLAKILPLRGESFFDRFAKALEDGNSREELRPTLQDLRHHQTLDYALMLLRYHSPGFDEMVLQERVDLIEETCSHINEFLEVLHKLMTFLEHGKPKRRGPAATKVAARDIKAAVLREVDGLTNRQIAQALCINTPSDFLIKGDHPTVRKMVRRGRSALVAALGEEGWQAQAQAMKDEANRWHSRSEVQRQAELEAEALGVPYDEVLKRLEEESRQSGRGNERGVQEEVVS
jgi:hypothetical protein